MEAFKQLQELISPKLTWKIFENVLEKHNNCKDIQLQGIQFGEGIKKGDSYLSSIVRFTVNYSGHVSGEEKTFQLHVIAKVLLKNLAWRNTFRSYDFFRNEICFYEKVWPELDAFQRKMKVKDEFQDLPVYLCGYFDGTNDYILLEDLSFQGYVSFDRSSALGIENVKAIMKLLARFHALGVSMHHANAAVFNVIANNLEEVYFHEKLRSWYIKFHLKLKEIALDAIKKEAPEYFAKFDNILKRDLYKEVCDECTSTTKYTTITHGDVWIANFLVRQDESVQPLLSKMIDFQLSRRSSLAQDISFFIYSCTDEEFRSKHYKEILQYYCEEFNTFYLQLNHDETGNMNILTEETLRNELKANGNFGLCMGIEAIVMSLLDEDEVSNLEELEGDKAYPLDSVWIVKPLKTQEKRQRVAAFIKHMIDNNFL